MKQEESRVWKANAQIAHLVFANPQNTNPEKLKEQFLVNAHHKNFLILFVKY